MPSTIAWCTLPSSAARRPRRLGTSRICHSGRSRSSCSEKNSPASRCRPAGFIGCRASTAAHVATQVELRVVLPDRLPDAERRPHHPLAEARRQVKPGADPLARARPRRARPGRPAAPAWRASPRACAQRGSPVAGTRRRVRRALTWGNWKARSWGELRRSGALPRGSRRRAGYAATSRLLDRNSRGPRPLQAVLGGVERSDPLDNRESPMSRVCPRLPWPSTDLRAEIRPAHLDRRSSASPA